MTNQKIDEEIDLMIIIYLRLIKKLFDIFNSDVVAMGQRWDGFEVGGGTK